LRLTFRNLCFITALLVFCAGFSSAQPAAKKTAHKAGSKHHARSRRHRTRKTSWKRHGQQRIDSDRAREIQEALIREHYLTGDATGEWDARTQSAMERYQSDNGWQSKVTPDSRALIKLGLGPNYSQEQLLNFPPAPADALASAAGSGSGHSTAVGASKDKQ
jgi:peptidoglycan hydrolase-like protein with peptidoglycan-binding domain